MRRHRLYHAALMPDSRKIEPDKAALRYLLQVLRCKNGQALELFNGQGLQCSASLETKSKNSAIIHIEQCQMLDRESALPLRLALAISKGERMDIAIQKAVELGVNEIIPLQSEHSVVNLPANRAEKRHQHWQGIIISACEQCGRNTLPTLQPLHNINNWLVQQHTGDRWLFTPQAEQRLTTQSKPEQGVTLLIGAEGGLSDKEIETARQHGFKALAFGPRILRTETAAIACISAIQTLWGDLG